MKETANLHHDLLPYIRSYAFEANQTGLPIIRALFLESPGDVHTYTTTDEYFFGSEFLVAPIVTSGGVRAIYFPQGTTYLEYSNKTSVHAGGTNTTVALDVHYVPVYVKAGAIIPRGDVFQGNNKWTSNWAPNLNIEVFPSYDVPSSSFTYYNSVTNQGVELCLSTNAANQSVTITYGDLGVPGQITVYGKGGQMNASLEAGGGKAVISDVVSLFA